MNKLLTPLAVLIGCGLIAGAIIVSKPAPTAAVVPGPVDVRIVADPLATPQTVHLSPYDKILLLGCAPSRLNNAITLCPDGSFYTPGSGVHWDRHWN